MMATIESRIARLEEITREGGQIAVAAFRPGQQTFSKISYKDGSSPVTEADFAVDRFLMMACAEAFPDCAWFSEETIDTPHRLSAARVIIADPIDGTRAFVSGHPQWCVSIALVEDGRPVMGCIYAPALDEMFVAGLGHGARLNGQALRVNSTAPEGTHTAFGPKPMIDWLNRKAGLRLEQKPRVPSLAYRIAAIAKGDADVGLAGPDSHDWDIAAADLILSEAGGQLLDLKGERPVYNRANPVHPALLAAGPALAQVILAGLSQDALAR